MGYGEGRGREWSSCVTRDISLSMAFWIRPLFWRADFRFLGRVAVQGPVKPMSNPLRRPSTM